MKANSVVVLWVLALMHVSAYAAGVPDLAVDAPGQIRDTPEESNNAAIESWKTHKTVYATIRNLGNADCGPFTVYFDVEEDPPTTNENHRPQVSKTYPGLRRDGQFKLKENFASLAHPDNANLRNVKQICVEVDPKKEIVEWKETNNKECYKVTR